MVLFYFQSIPTAPLAAYDVSKMPCNLPKNRFENIFPCEEVYVVITLLLMNCCLAPLCSADDTSRVVLSTIPSKVGSDYINASYIDVSAS